MGFFGRLSDIISANLNDLLDRMEDPEKMLKQLLSEMEQAVGQAKEALVEALTVERRVAKEMAHYQARVAEWEAKAVEAVKKDRDDLARKALELQSESEDILSALENELDTARKNTEAMRTQLRGIQAKYQEARRKQASLAARNRSAEAQTSQGRSPGRGELRRGLGGRGVRRPDRGRQGRAKAQRAQRQAQKA